VLFRKMRRPSPETACRFSIIKSIAMRRTVVIFLRVRVLRKVEKTLPRIAAAQIRLPERQLIADYQGHEHRLRTLYRPSLFPHDVLRFRQANRAPTNPFSNSKGAQNCVERAKRVNSSFKVSALNASIFFVVLDSICSESNAHSVPCAQRPLRSWEGLSTLSYDHRVPASGGPSVCR
jgi:hypothetical protein